MRVAHVQAVARAGVIHVVAAVVGHQPVVGGVVDALHRKHRPELIALGRVVVDDVEDDFDALLMQRLHHPLELLHLLPRLAARRVLVMRGEIPDRVVAPVIAQAALEQQRIVDELMDGEQLHRGDAERLQMFDGGRMRESRVRAALIVGDVRMALRKSFDVDFVDDRLVPRRARTAVAGPVELRIRDHRLRHERRGIGVVLPVRIVEEMSEDGLVPPHLSVHRFAVRIEQQLRRIAAIACARLPRSVHAKSVALTGADVGNVPMPDESGHLRQIDAVLFAVAVEKAKLDARRDFGEDREIRPRSVVARAQRIRISGPDFHCNRTRQFECQRGTRLAFLKAS